MKRFLKFVATMLLGVAMFFVFSECFRIYETRISDKYHFQYGFDDASEKYKEDHPILSAIWPYMPLNGIGLWGPLTNRCNTKENIGYFSCNDFQVWLNKYAYKHKK